MKVKVAFILRLNYEELKNSSHDEEAKLPQKVGGILPISWCKEFKRYMDGSGYCDYCGKTLRSEEKTKSEDGQEPDWVKDDR
ncbi:MAG: hypothetical protein V5A76_06115 [Candidatus Thermoplasmatota archaeon]